MNAMQEYQKESFSAKLATGEERAFDVYTRGAGPVVLIVQELPGIGGATLRLADFFVQEGFTVVMPHLFGPLGRTDLLVNTMRLFCLRKEFTVFAKGKTSPVVSWLRALCQDLRQRHDTPGIAVIGMCLTGNFSMSLMADEAVLAGVASQPSLPIGDSADLHMSETEIQQIRTRLDSLPPMQTWRFEKDPLCKGARFDALDKAFNDDSRQRIALNVIPGKGHAVLTLDFVDEEGHPTYQARQSVLAYFKESLGVA